MDQILRRLQLTQLEILQVIDAFCKDNCIQYSLYAGTLLGAIRHQGFIPWDDDLDICMDRSEYERFLSLWESRGPKGYLLQNKENTPLFTQSFSKIRKEHTAFLQYEWERGRYHTGIFVDVFPIDRIPSNTFEKKLFQWKALHYQLLTREFIPPKASAPVKMVSNMLLKVAPDSQRRQARERDLLFIESFHDASSPRVAIETQTSIRMPLPADLMDQYIDCSFEGVQFPIFKNWDGYLRCKFGDYMTLPPESERTWKHHPIILDFEHDLEELER